MKGIYLAYAVWLGLTWAAAAAAAQDDIFAQPRLGFVPKPGWPPAGPAPRLADGKPDLTGPWAPNAIAENVNLVGIGVQVPFKPEAEALYKSRIARLGKDDPEARCLPPGVPRLNTTPYPFR